MATQRPKIIIRPLPSNGGHERRAAQLPGGLGAFQPATLETLTLEAPTVVCSADPTITPGAQSRSARTFPAFPTSFGPSDCILCPQGAYGKGTIIVGMGYWVATTGFTRVSFVVWCSFLNLNDRSQWTIDYQVGDDTGQNDAGPYIQTYLSQGVKRGTAFPFFGTSRIRDAGGERILHFPQPPGQPNMAINVWWIERGTNIAGNVGAPWVRRMRVEWRNIYDINQQAVVQFGGCCVAQAGGALECPGPNCAAGRDDRFGSFQGGFNEFGCACRWCSCGTTCAGAQATYAADRGGGRGWFLQSFTVESNTSGNDGIIRISPATMVNLNQLSQPVEGWRCCSSSQAGGYSADSLQAIRCRQLDLGSADTRQCTETMQAFCAANMTSPACIEYCERPDSRCDTILQRFCTERCIEDASRGLVRPECLPPSTDPLRSVCGCFLPTNFYDTFFDELQGKLTGLPITRERQCLFPDCTTSRRLTNQYKINPPQCPALVACIQNVQVGAGGNIGQIQVNNRAECKSVQVVEQAPTPGPGPGPGPTPSTGGPTITQGPAATTQARTATFVWTGPSGSSFECKLDGASAFTACSSPYTTTTLAPGMHTFRVREQGQTAETTHTWTVQTAAPGPTPTPAPTPAEDGGWPSWATWLIVVGSILLFLLVVGAFIRSRRRQQQQQQLLRSATPASFLPGPGGSAYLPTQAPYMQPQAGYQAPLLYQTRP